MSHNWRELPADLIEEIISFYNCGKYPPSFNEMEAIAARFRFVVWLVPPRAVPTSNIDHQRGVIVIPYMDDAAFMAEALMHELAHLLLRMPVAPEIHYEPSDQDEHHAVATLVHQRMRTKATPNLTNLL